MKLQTRITPREGTEKQTSLADIIQQIEKICRKCQALTLATCITRCDAWKLKNEFRKLYEMIGSPSYIKNLLNTIKNRRRLAILNIISNEVLSLSELQQKLKKCGYQHSQQTILNEYITPLIGVGLVKENRNKYHATTFGSRVNELIEPFKDIEDVLPPHSECYEEITLSILLNEPKTYEALEEVVPIKNIPRVLNRLKKAGLIEVPPEKDYIFYFRTRRDSNKVEFSPTERKVYQNIPEKGISARKLAERTNISLRRTYKYLKRLKKKKLVFTRKKPKSYALTLEGIRIAILLQNIRELLIEALAAGALLTKDESVLKLLMSDTPHPRRRKKKKKELPSLPIIRIISPK